MVVLLSGSIFRPVKSHVRADAAAPFSRRQRERGKKRNSVPRYGAGVDYATSPGSGGGNDVLHCDLVLVRPYGCVLKF